MSTTKYPSGEVRVDVQWRSKTGDLTFFQVGMSSPEREAEAAVKALQVPAVAAGTLVMVVRDGDFGKRFKAAMKAKDPGGTLASKVHVRTVGDVLLKLYS